MASLFSQQAISAAKSGDEEMARMRNECSLRLSVGSIIFVVVAYVGMIIIVPIFILVLRFVVSPGLFQ